MKKYFLFILLLFLSTNVLALDIKDNKINVSLNSCIDGDTAKFNYQNETIKVRFLAIDTPEIKHGKNIAEPYSYEAKEYTCNELKKANNIILEFDSNSDKQDKYDRYLVWIFVDNDLLQQKLIKKGYAKVAYLYGDYKYTDTLKKEQRIARKNKLGIWENEIYINPIYIIIPSIIGLLLLIILLFIFKYKK